jgi:hypothetical protein
MTGHAQRRFLIGIDDADQLAPFDLRVITGMMLAQVAHADDPDSQVLHFLLASHEL